jgi:hypothetical protein
MLPSSHRLCLLHSSTTPESWVLFQRTLTLKNARPSLKQLLAWNFPYPRLSCNQEIEIYNNKSITATVKAKLAAVPRPIDPNVGPPLKAMYSLTEDELNDLVAKKALCLAYSLLPLGLL